MAEKLLGYIIFGLAFEARFRYHVLRFQIRVMFGPAALGVTFHDLRGTAVTRLAVAGCTDAEIATLTGHSLRDVHGILDAHYLNRDPALAESAVRKLESRTKTPN